jgi:hypothetical protein
MQGAQFLWRRDGGMDRSRKGIGDRFGAGEPADRCHPSHARLRLRNLCRLLFRSIHSRVEEPAVGDFGFCQNWALLMESRRAGAGRGRARSSAGAEAKAAEGGAAGQGGARADC